MGMQQVSRRASPPSMGPLSLLSTPSSAPRSPRSPHSQGVRLPHSGEAWAGRWAARLALWAACWVVELAVLLARRLARQVVKSLLGLPLVLLGQARPSLLAWLLAPTWWPSSFSWRRLWALTRRMRASWAFA